MIQRSTRRRRSRSRRNFSERSRLRQLTARRALLEQLEIRSAPGSMLVFAAPFLSASVLAAAAQAEEQENGDGRAKARIAARTAGAAGDPRASRQTSADSHVRSRLRSAVGSVTTGFQPQNRVSAAATSVWNTSDPLAGADEELTQLLPDDLLPDDLSSGSGSVDSPQRRAHPAPPPTSSSGGSDFPPQVLRDAKDNVSATRDQEVAGSSASSFGPPAWQPPGEGAEGESSNEPPPATTGGGGDTPTPGGVSSTNGGPATMACGFPLGLEDWTVEQRGGSESGQGSVEMDGDAAVMREGDSFVVTLEHSFLVPDDPTVMSFTYADLSFDGADEDFVNDAFEAALVDSSGLPLVGTIGAGRDAFFNVSEDQEVALGAGASLTDSTVNLDVSGLFPQTSATLVLRLVNNDTDVGSSVRILDVQCPFSGGLPPKITVRLDHDTAPPGPGTDQYQSDLLTNDPTIAGTVTAEVGVNKLELQIDDGTFQDITSSLAGNSYQFQPTGLLPGDHRLTVRATDTDGQSSEQSLDFRLNAPPVPDAGGDRTVAEGTTVEWSALGSFDVEDDIYRYEWTLEDGSLVTDPVTQRPYADDGSFPIRLTVTDTAGSVVRAISP